MVPTKPFNLFLYRMLASLLLILIGIILFATKNIIFDATVKKILTLTPNGKTYELWKRNPMPLNFDVYFFNWTNPQDFYDLSTKPHFKEVGPFRFGQENENVDVVFHEDDTVSFNKTKKWFFKRSESVGSLDDPITSINPVAVAAAYTVRDWPYFIRKGLSISLSSLGASLEVTKSVGDVLFYGYDEPIINLAQKLPVQISKLPPMDKFAWFYGRNGSKTFDGRFTMETGVNGPLGDMKLWNNWKHTPYYEGQCGDVWGSSGDFFPENIKKTNLSLFLPEACRTMTIDYEEEKIVQEMVGYKFGVGDSFLDNGTLVPENKCFCTGECVPYGAVNVSTCRYGSPGFVSLPHFYKADPYYLNNIEGLNPQAEKHEFAMTFEPRTGIPLHVTARFQLNLLVQPIESIGLFENTPKLFFPVLWFEQVVTIPDDLATLLMILLRLPLLLTLLGIFLISGGTIFLFFSIFKLCNTNLFGQDKSYYIKTATSDLQIKKKPPKIGWIFTKN